MNFLAPGFLAAAGLVALGVVGLHFLSTREPRMEQLPTARFVPDAPVRASALTVRLSDLLLLVLRVLVVMLAGAALARPVLTPARTPVARILAVDVSRGTGQPTELADSARANLTRAATVIFFDSTAREMTPGVAADSLAAYVQRPASAAAPAGSLSAALIAARRAAARLRDTADSLELVVISPYVKQERDAATDALRALWPGRVTTVQVAAASNAAASDKVVVEWADSGANGVWTGRGAADTIGAVRAGDAVLVYPFVRQWRAAAQADSSRRVYARWMDGEPAAFERAMAKGCVRSLAIPLPTEGDALLRPDFQRFLAGLSAPCGATADLTPLTAEFLKTFHGDGPLAASNAIARRTQRVTVLMPWLLGAALLFALVELVARRRTSRATSGAPAVPVGAGSATRSVA
jgi:hypothetical protein